MKFQVIVVTLLMVIAVALVAEWHDREDPDYYCHTPSGGNVLSPSEEPCWT